MKIKKVEACRYSGDAEAAYVAEIVVVTVHTDAGVEGKGFASAPPGVGVLIKQIIENVLAPKVVDTDPQLTTCKVANHKHHSKHIRSTHDDS